MKRWNFGDLRASHEVYQFLINLMVRPRQDPGKVLKEKMAGLMGIN